MISVTTGCKCFNALAAVFLEGMGGIANAYVERKRDIFVVQFKSTGYILGFAYYHRYKMIRGNASIMLFCHLDDLECKAISAANNLQKVFLNECERFLKLQQLLKIVKI